MTVAIAREEWAPSPVVYVLLFASCAASLSLYPRFSKAAFSARAAPTAPFLPFQKRFLLLFSLASVIEGLQSVFGEYELARHGLGREQTASILAAGAAAALFLGTVSGILSDVIGPRKACIVYCMLHLFVGALKSLIRLPCIWAASMCLALASSVFSFCFETWMVTEHDKQGHSQELLGDTFWLMTFYESASLIGSQGLGNLLIKDLKGGPLLTSAVAAIFAVVGIIALRTAWTGGQYTLIIGSYRKSFSSHVLKDKRIWALMWAQASIHFSVLVFWFLWAPTMVADGREVQLSRIFPCLIGARMLGSTGFPWFHGTASSPRNEDSLTVAFIVAGLALSAVAYDYQEIGVLVMLFCVFHACVGFILPSLARLRTMVVVVGVWRILRSLRLLLAGCCLPGVASTC